MGIRIKIFSGFLILAIMLAVAGVWSIYELSTIGASVQKLLDDNYRSISAAKTMIEALEREDSAVLLLMLGNRDEGRSIMNSAYDLFEQGYKIAENNLTVEGEKSYVDDIRIKYNSYKNLLNKQIVGTDRERDLDWYSEEVHKCFLDVKVSVQNLMNINDLAMYQTASNVKERSHRAIMPGIVAILSSFVFSILFSYLINYYVIGPIIRLTNGIRKFLETRKEFDARVETNDEIMELANSIKELIRQTRSN
ncbi:MAG: MCP four helix bundle domain-containing protein [Deltaproteobacteria bacterium]|nr:MCP four helix bundle domain-containing protein [Deltaproteobacteria bacterium]